MALTATHSTRKFPVLLLAIIVILLPTAVHGKDVDGGGCVRRVGDLETPAPGSCLCYDKCAHKGGQEAGLTDAHAQTCFVECVLRDRGWDPEPPLFPAAGLLLSKTVRLAVTRPRVSRSREEKEETEELLVVELGFEAGGVDGGMPTHVFLNLPEGGEKQFISLSKTTNHRYVDTIVVQSAERAGKDTAVRKFPVGGNKLEALGSDGDETVVVSLVPFVFEDVPRPYWYERHMVAVRSVRVVYEPKKL